MDISIFTNGSKMDADTGAGIFSDEINLHIEKLLAKYITVFKVEKVDIYSFERNIVNKTIRILSDSKTT